MSSVRPEACFPRLCYILRVFLGVSFVSLALGLLALSGAFWVVERLWPALPPRRRPEGSTQTDILYWFLTPFASRIALVVAAVAAAVLIAAVAGRPEGHGLQGFFQRDTAVGRQPLWLQTIELVILLDLASYWGHRWFHRVRPLWGFHAVHHSSEWVDWLSSVRVHPVNELGMKLLQATPLLGLGFDFSAVSVAGPALTLYAILLHANVPWGFGPLRYVIATPVFHRWHHTTEEEGLDKNFSGAFVWPDMLFGTFYLPGGRQPERFGIQGRRPPRDFFGQLAWGLKSGKAAAA